MEKYVLRDGIPADIKETLHSYPPLVQELLFVRGITDSVEAEKFLHPDYDTHTYDPYLLKDMDKVVERIMRAMKKDETIAIYSDYDADGIPGAVVFSDFFKKIGYTKVTNYIPLRNEEGFGLNEDAITSIAQSGATLLVTIDCGITDVAEVLYAQSLGIDVIITDHHLPGAIVPEAYAIINPKQKDCPYPEKMLCGSGVIFKVVQALIRHKDSSFPLGQEKWMIDMVGLATLSDMVPLTGENRVFAYYGMTVFRKSNRVGIQKLLSLLKIDQQTITEDDIAFMVTPRINAASRMGIPLDAFTLLSTTDEVEAGMLAEHLNNKNDERKGLVASMIKEIKKRIKSRGEDKAVIVLGDPQWKPSLLGLIANSFSDEHGRPVFLWGREGSNGSSSIKGSCRSGGDTHIVHLMEKAKDAFIDFGGHKGAGGFSVSQENIHTLEERLNKAFEELSLEEKEIEKIKIDRKLSLDLVNWDTWKQIAQFAPFGYENSKPLFLFEGIEIAQVKQFGKEKNHLELKFTASNGKQITAIGFFSSADDYDVLLSAGLSVNLVATLEKSNFRNFPELRLRIVDLF